MSKESQNPTKTEKENNLETILKQIKKAKKKKNIEYIVKNILTKHEGMKYVKILDNDVNNIDNDVNIEKIQELVNFFKDSSTNSIPRTVKTLRITPMSKNQPKYIYLQDLNIQLTKPRYLWIK